MKTYDVGESDKSVVLLLKERGKTKAYAKGARKPKSKFMASTQIFTYSDFIIDDRFNALAQTDVIENFYDIRNNYDRLCCGNYMLELTDKTLFENMPCDEVLLLLLKSLSVLAKGTAAPGFVRVVFELKFFQLNGYAPETDGCNVCGSGEDLYWGGAGFVCPHCAPDGTLVKLCEGSVRAIKYILASDIKDLFKFSVSGDVLGKIKSANKIIFYNNFEFALNSERFLE